MKKSAKSAKAAKAPAVNPFVKKGAKTPAMPMKKGKKGC